MADNLDTLMTKAEAAEALGLSLSTVQSLVSRGDIATTQTRFGKLIPAEAVEEYRATRLGKRGKPPKNRHI